MKQFILVLFFIFIVHMNNCKPTFADPLCVCVLKTLQKLLVYDMQGAKILFLIIILLQNVI